MSTLTDLFTSMANKIRSKTGTQTTYTPAQMVSDGIDDVYDAGYAAGGGGGVTPTSITPSNSSPASMTAGNAYEPTTNGYAIASNPTILTPSNTSPPSIASGTIYKGGGSGYAIGSYSSITPSSSSPVSLSSGSMYKPSSSGYAIDSYSSISPSTSGTYFSSGMKKMSSSGYAYSSRPQMTETTLWTNSAPTSNFNDNTNVDLSDAISNYDYIGINWKSEKGASTYTARNIWSVADIKKSNRANASSVVLLLGGYTISSGGHYLRPFSYTSDTRLNFGNANRYGAATNPVQDKIIPISIIGLKL